MFFNTYDMDIKERFQIFINYKGLSKRKFQESIGVSNSYIQNISNGISAEILKRITKTYTELNTDWLLYGEGDMLKSQSREMERINTLLDTITTLQEAINAKSETIAILNERIHQLENQLKNKS